MIYLLMYSVLAFFVLVNFFLAIVVEAFMKVKEGIIKQITENSSPCDTWDIPYKLALYTINRWPSRMKVLKLLEDDEEIDHLQRLVKDNKDKIQDDAFSGYQGLVDIDCLMKMNLGFTPQSAEKFLRAYQHTVPELEFEKYEQDNQRIMLEDLKDTMNKRNAILNSMRITEEELEAKRKDTDVGALQLSVSLLDQEIDK